MCPSKLIKTGEKETIVVTCCKYEWHGFSMVFLQQFPSNSGNTPAEKTLRQALVGDGLYNFFRKKWYDYGL
jgi:hypothetical protein